VEPFRSILLGLFFLSIGMLLDLGAIAERPLFVFSMALALIATKAVVISAIGLASRMRWREALGLGLLLSQGGEFGFVLFAQARGAFLIDADAASLFGAVVTLSMATTPFLMALTRRLREAPEHADQEREAAAEQTASALIVGYGRFGQTVAQMLMAAGVSVTLIDTDVEMIDVAEGFGAKVYFGDGTRFDLLRQAGAADAELILFCIDGDQIEPDLVHAVHKAFPQAAIYVRGYDRRSVIKLRDTPAEYVMREVLESALRMARMALEKMGLSEEEIWRAEDFYRANDKERLSRQIASGDLRAGREIIVTEPKGRGGG
jgi:CPA2 family monovalent cation:H+ antiporter-2/glutathione-regulated potassium-efflux system protein KefB